MAQRRKIARWVILALLLGVTGIAAWRAQRLLTGSGAGNKSFARELTVDVVRVSKRSVPLVIGAPGTVQTHHNVAVRARVGGMLEKVAFREGDEVKQGQLLFVIDPEPYEVQIAQARGQVEQDRAKLATDTANAKRMARLVKQGYVSSQDNENAAALVLQDKGTLAADEAKLDEAKLQLGYTRITAPIGGKTGALAYKAGNLVQANDTTPLVTINQISPILVQFDIPQSQLAPLMRHRDDPALSVFVRDPSGRQIASGGRLVFIDNAINQAAGTLGLKAEFPNTDHVLWPGELVSVGLRLAVQHDAVVIPAVAVQPGQGTSYVYTVENGHVAARNIDVAREYEGYAVIDKGLEPGDVVVVHIPRELHEGVAVHTRVLTDSAVASEAEDTADGAPGAAT